MYQLANVPPLQVRSFGKASGLYTALTKAEIACADFEEIDQNLKSILNFIAVVCTKHPSVAETHLKPLHLRTLNAFEGLSSETALQKSRMTSLWNTLGESVPGVGKAQLQNQLKAKAKAQSGGLVGCSWYRCLLYGREPHPRVVMLQDSNNCRKAQYCSGEPQRHDRHALRTNNHYFQSGLSRKVRTKKCDRCLSSHCVFPRDWNEGDHHRVCPALLNRRT